ncbi:MAG: XdhC family protein [Flavobacteriaceae bacterium]|nr:XdhC family protein [Flavobacteriaceae bacterium]
MTHEFKNILETYLLAKEQATRAVLATVVALEGSSYRKPGVRMLLLENGTMIGAVSGGCVEKDIARQSEAVFHEDKPRMMTYDGRYRLGCEGILYILLEPFRPDETCVSKLQECFLLRNEFELKSTFMMQEGNAAGLGTSVMIQGQSYLLNPTLQPSEELKSFVEVMPPCFKLMIFGAEHDAVQLCQFAAGTGWEVTVISGPLESKSFENFPGATAFYSVSPDQVALEQIDDQTAVMVMSHNFANDLKFLLELKETKPAYLGLLGPAHRREKLLDQLLEYCPELSQEFIDSIHGPAGLNIGAETPQEIAISILSEVLSTVREKTPIPLKKKKGGIHA